MLDEPFELFESCRRQPDARTLETDAACAWLLAERTGAVAKRTTVRLPDDLANNAEAVARIRGECVNQLIVDALAAEIERVRCDEKLGPR